MKTKGFLTVLIMLLFISSLSFAQNLGVTGLSPDRNKIDAARNSSITINFDMIIDGNTVTTDNIIVRGEQTGLIKGTFSGGGTGSVTFDPTDDFKAGELVTVTITTGLKSSGGATLAGSLTYQFTTVYKPGKGIFTENVVSVNADSVVSVYAADVDGDGDIDILSTSAGDSKIAWYENDGSENYTEHALTTNAAGPYFVSTADIDGDGNLDILAAITGFAKLVWYQNDGNRNFTEQTISSGVIAPYAVVATDIDGDGDMDIISSDVLNYKLLWFENDGSQSFTEKGIATNIFSQTNLPVDVDDDGDVDIVTINSFNNEVSWFENDGSQNFTARSIITNLVGIYGAHAADMDNDGDMDILSVSKDDNKINWYENDGSQNFTTHSIATPLQPVIVRTADVDGDGDLDVLAASWGDSTIAYYENDGSQNFTSHSITSSASTTFALFTSDVDGDGDLDVLAADNSTDKVSWYENNNLVTTPVITAIPDTTIDFGSTFSYPVSFTSDPAPVFSLTQAPSGMTISPATGVIEWTPSTAQIGDHQVTVQAVNSAGSDAESFQITVNLPAWSQIGNSLTTYDFRFAVSGDGVPYLAYNENQILTVKKFDGNSWAAVGNTGLTPSPLSFSIAIDNSGAPYIAYADMLQENKATVIKFNGSSWATIGNAGFSYSEFIKLSIYTDPNGVINVAGVTTFGTPEAFWFDEENSYWAEFGFNELQNYGVQGDFSFAPGSNGMPYFAFRGIKNPDFITVKGFVIKYDKTNNSWIELGSLSDGVFLNGAQSLAIDINGTPYIAIADISGAPTTKYSVMKYENSSWASVGGDFGDSYQYYGLAIDKAGTPFVCYDDTSHGRKLTVVQFNGTNWESVGDPGITDEAVKAPSIGISDEGSLFVASANDDFSQTTVLKHFRSINPPIVKTNTGLTLDQGTTAVIDTTKLNVTDADTDNQSLIFKITTAPVNGEIRLSGSAASKFTQADIVAGNVAYAHNGSETTSDSLTFSVSDIDHVISGQRFNITIIDVDITPVVAVNETLTLDEGAAAVIDSAHLRGTDSDTEDSTLVYSIGASGLPLFGKLQKDGADFPSGQDVSFTQGDINAGRISYVHFGGETPYDSLAFSLKDANNTLAPQYFRFTINAIDDLPVIVHNSGLTLQQGSSAIIDSSKLLVADEESTPRYYIQALPSHGTLELDGVQLEESSPFYQSDINNLKLSYIHDGSKTFDDSFTFYLWDGSNYLRDQVFNIAAFSSSWTSLGSQIYGLEGEGVQPSFAVDGNGTSYIMTYSGLKNVVLKNTAPYKWETVGEAGLSAEISAGIFGMDIDQSGTPYIVISDAANGSKVSVMKFNGTTWEFVGARGFTTYGIESYPLDIKIDHDGTPYVSYVYQGYANVMKFDGSNWQLVGGDGIAAVAGNNIWWFMSLAFNSSGTPYLALSNQSSSGKARVIKFDGGSWVDVGNSAFSVGQAKDIDIAINSSGTPYVAYNDETNKKATVMKFDGEWVNVGNANGISESGSASLSLKFDNDDIPFVGYQDLAHLATITVMGFYNNNWVVMGSSIGGFANGDVGSVSLDIDNSGSLYVGYAEYDFNSFSSWVAASKFERKFTAPLKINKNAGLTLNEGARSVIDSTLLRASSDDQSDPAAIYYTVTNLPDYGKIMVSDSAMAEFTQADINTGNLMYVNGGAETVYDDFTFSVSDGMNNELTDQNFHITIIPVNDAPVILPPGLPDVSFPEDSSYTLELDTLAWDNESNYTGLVWSVSSLTGLKVGGILSAGNVSSYLYLLSGKINTAAANSQPEKKPLKTNSELKTGNKFKAGVSSESTGTLAAGGALIQISTTDSILITIDNDAHTATFSATTNYNIKDVPFLFTVMDPDSATASDTLTVTVTPVNDNMALVNNAGLTLDEGVAAVIDTSKLFVTDIDTDDSLLLFTITTLPVNGEIQLSDSATAAFTQADINAGNVAYVHDGSETTSDTMIVSVTDGEYEITDQSFIITVTPVNDAPVVAGIPNVIFPEDSTYTIDLDDYAYDADNALSELSWSIASVTTPTPGSIVKSGKTSSYLFIVSSKNISSANKTKTSKKGKQKGKHIRFKLQSEVAGGELGTQKADSDSIMIVIDSLTNIATFTATLNYNIADVPFLFTATDTSNASGSDTTTVTVTPVNDIPVNRVAPVISGTAMEEHELSVDNGSWTDADSDSLSYTYQWYSDSDSLDYNGTAITDAVSSTYMLTSNEVGKYVYAEITADDGNGGSVSVNSNYTATEIITGVEDEEIPKEFSLSQNYPNPFNPSTILRYGLKEEADVRLEVFNLLGESVITLVNERQSAGYYNLSLNLAAYSTGVYIYRLHAGSFVSVKKMIMVK